MRSSIRERDYSAIYNGSKCVLCGELASGAGKAWHAARHLADASAVVVIDMKRHTDCVVPTDSIPDEKPPRVTLPRTPGPRLPAGFRVWRP